MRRLTVIVLLSFLTLAACTLEDLEESANDSGGSVSGETVRVIRVVDGDTIRVDYNGEDVSVRYIGMNTPESDEVCYDDATNANKRLVEGKQVTLVRDVSDTDQYGRLLRYIYVGDTFVNEALVRDGYAEVVRYEPDTSEFEHFRTLEQEATQNNRGCHPTGIFDDGSYSR